MIWNPFVGLYRYLHKNYSEFQGCEPCPHRPLPLMRRYDSLPVVDFPVDVVFTWVNGSDEQWLKRRDAWMPREKERHHLSQGSSLFADNDELRFSLRSIEEYAPWVRKIYILTDGQKPFWLKATHDKLIIVDHRDCIPAEYLPTFNSHVIEAYLHRIPGLSEQYIYMNDDFFLASKCGPEDFFTANGRPYLFMDWRYSRRYGYARKNTPHARSYPNTRAFMQARGVCFEDDIITAHVPYPSTKENAREAALFFEEAILAFSPHKFRTWDDMAFYSHCLPHWSYIMKKAVAADVPFFYINTARFDRDAYYSALLREKDSGVLPLFFCLNDVGEPAKNDRRHEDMREFLQSFFPRPSQFENQCR